MVTDLPFPETLPTLEAQFALLAAGRKAAVLLPHWSPQWRAPAGFAVHATPCGTFFFDPRNLVAYVIDRDLAADEIGRVLGYGVPRKPARPVGALALLAADGSEVLAVLVDAGSRAAAQAALEPMAGPAQRVELVPVAQIIRGRLAWWTQHFATQEKLTHA